MAQQRKTLKDSGKELSICRLICGFFNNRNFRLGLVESKLRVLVMKLEVVPGIESSPPYPFGFDHSLIGSSLETALNSKNSDVSILDELSDSKKFLCTSYYIGLEVKLKSSSGKHQL